MKGTYISNNSQITEYSRLKLREIESFALSFRTDLTEMYGIAFFLTYRTVRESEKCSCIYVNHSLKISSQVSLIQ